jgi:hypothetical protein
MQYAAAGKIGIDKENGSRVPPFANVATIGGSRSVTRQEFCASSTSTTPPHPTIVKATCILLFVDRIERGCVRNQTSFSETPFALRNGFRAMPISYNVMLTLT